MTRREEIEQAAMQVGGVHPDWDVLECFRVGYKEGAQWADKTMIDKACEWFQNQDMSKYIGVLYSGVCSVSFANDKLVEMFRKAMEE